MGIASSGGHAFIAFPVINSGFNSLQTGMGIASE